MNTKKNLIRITVYGVLVSIFQACAAGFTPNMEPAAPAPDLSFGHPSLATTPSTTLVSGRIVMGDGDYLKSVFEDVFTGPSLAAADAGYMQAVINQEFLPVQQMLARSCDPLTDGTADNCGGSLSNTNIPMDPSSSAIREAARIQTCRRLLASDGILQVVLDKVTGDQNTPNTVSVGSAIQLFYPATDPDPALLNTLLQMDTTLAGQSQSVKNRWRIILLTLCESPTWQVL